MEAKFGYKRDKRCKWLTAVYIAVIFGLLALVTFGMESSYMKAWTLAVIGAVAALYLLSIPRYVKVDDDYLEIQCTVEMTRIDVRDVVSIRRTRDGEYHNRLFCLLGSYGFFGYFGYYLDLRDWDLVKLYATERNNLAVIDDIYEQRYIISCRDCDQLIESVLQAKIARSGRSGDST